MLTIQQAFEHALQHHQSGRLAEAEALYRQILATQPDYSPALHYLGVIAFQSARHDFAVELISRALVLDPNNHAARFNLAEIYRTTGRLDEAVGAYRRAMRLKPDDPLAHFGLGNVLRKQGRLDEAVLAYRRALQLNPQHLEARLNLGNALKAQGRWDDAVEAYRSVLELKPDCAEACNNLGVARAGQGRLQDAVAAYRRALELKPDDADAHNNLGAALKEKGEFEDAIAALRRAVELKPGHVEAHSNLGAALIERGQFAEAMAACRQALELNPEHSDVKFNYSTLLLLRGDFEQGWPFHESRWNALHPPRNFSQPRWDGGSVDGKRVLVHAEQGLGDSIHFIRYAKLIAERGGKVVVECPRSLVDLFRSAQGVSEVVATGDPLPPFDLHVPMLSQAFVFKTTSQTIPGEVPYLFAEPARREAWRQRLGADKSPLRVGLAWVGNPLSLALRKRHLAFEMLLPLLKLHGVEFFSLQIGPGAEQLQRCSAAPAIVDHTAHIHNFADTAAFMAELDLIISVDTAVAHLAGALARPVWTLLPFSPDWRWGLEREDTPWYPTMRLFRQPALGDWAAVIQRVAEELSRAVATGSIGSKQAPC